LFLVQVHGQGGVKFQNWAKTYGSSPELYFQPTSVEEIREVRRVHPGDNQLEMKRRIGQEGL